jgi:hypothetical protein
MNYILYIIFYFYNNLIFFYDLYNKMIIFNFPELYKNRFYYKFEYLYPLLYDRQMVNEIIFSLFI